MEEVISRTGCGLYTAMLQTYGLFCYFTNALAYMNLPLYLPMITCDVHLSATTISAVDFCVYIGMAIGGFLLCAVSDVVGRKTIIALSLILIFLGVLIASFAYGYFAILFSMILFGSGLEANMNVIKVLFYETIPEKYRYVCISGLDVIWITGMISALGFYWLVAPVLLQFYNDNQRFLNWRIIVLMSVFLSIILACATAVILESPKYLLFERRPRDAMEVMREIYAINKSKLYTTFQIQDNELIGKITDFGISNESDIPNSINTKRLRIIFSRIHKSLLVLVRKHLLFNTLLAIVFRLILLVGHHPLLLLLSRSLTLEKPETTDKYLLWHFEHPIFRDCFHFDKEQDHHLYKDYLILCSCCFFGGILFMILIKLTERKTILTFLGSTLFLSGIFSVLLGYVVNHYTMRFAFSGLMMIAYSMAISCVDLMILDMFPTAVRSTAMGETMIFARLANVFIIKYMTVSVQWLLIAFGCLLEFGAILSFVLHKFRNTTIMD